jgi:polyferredoxin
MKDLEKEIELIKERNKRVEKNKAWETSLVRRLSIAILTYIIVVTYSLLIKEVSNVFLTSLVPVIGFLLSTLSINLIRKLWEKKKGI